MKEPLRVLWRERTYHVSKLISGRQAVRFALAVSCLALLGACTPPTRMASQSQAQDSGKPLVLTTFTVLADMARNVAGDHLQVRSIVKQGAEIHGYQPTPSAVSYTHLTLPTILLV